MKEPGLDGRHRDKSAPKKGEIQQKRGDTLNKKLPKPIPQFRADTKLETMRRATGQTSVEKVRMVAAKINPTISGGCQGYRASKADQAAWDQARRPKSCKLERNHTLARIVARSLRCCGHPSRSPAGSSAHIRRMRATRCHTRRSIAPCLSKPAGP